MVAVAGPSLPPGFQRATSSTDSDDDGGDIGPVPSTRNDVAAEDGSIGEGTRAFLEREARRAQAQKDARLAAEKAATTRPEWMLKLPSTSNAASLQSVAGNPLNLKSRGFAQNTPRVSARSTGASTTEEVDTTLWTETPQQKLQRLQDEANGVTSKNAEEAQTLTLQQKAQMQRDKETEAKWKAQRKDKSLVEEHSEKRRQERKREAESRSHHRRHRSRSPNDERSSTRRHRSRSPDDSNRRSTSSRHRHREHRKSKHTSPSPPPRKLTRQEREDLDLQNGRMAAPSIWDRDAALSVGGKLMDEKKRAKMLADANALGDRFGSGSKRFM